MGQNKGTNTAMARRLRSYVVAVLGGGESPQTPKKPTIASAAEEGECRKVKGDQQ